MKNLRPWLLSGLLAACATNTPTPTPPPALPTETLIPTPMEHAVGSGGLSNDFAPPVGWPEPAPPRESPGEFRLLTATSSDGKVFEPTGQVIMDQANVPDLILGDDNLLYLYFTGWQLGERQNITAVALSPDLGRSWYFKYLTFEGRPPDMPGPADPDVVRLADGTFRLYMTTEVRPHHLGVVYMDSVNGVNFGPQTTAFEIATNALDSTTFLFKDTWRMFVLDSDKPEQWHATATDGKTFTLLEKTPFEVNGEKYIVANGVETGEGYRLYGFSIPAKNFRSFFSLDGVKWEVEPEVPLAFDAGSSVESEYIKDPAVVQLPDGSYLMVYVSKIPR